MAYRYSRRTSADSLHQSTDSHKWALIEASLFALRATADNFTQACNTPLSDSQMKEEILFKVINEFTNFPYNPLLMNTAIALLGDCSTLFCERTEELNRALQFIVSALKSPELVTTAATALDTLAENCGEEMADEIENILIVAKPLILDSRLDVCECLLRTLCSVD